MPTQPEVVEHTIATPTLGRYLVTAPQGEDPAPLLVGFHGYGENAELHMQALCAIPGSDRWRIASVQGLHCFYERRTGSVVSSWMTSQHREQAIADNIRYVHDVVAALRSESAPHTPLVYAGFSQGVAMAYRAALSAGHPCDGLLALAGDVPPELHDAPTSAWPPILLGCGRTDAWYTDDKLRADRRFFDGRGIAVDTVMFDGGHEWHADYHQAAGRFLDGIDRRTRQTSDQPR
ncbi:MAG: phospholipase [Acidobacteria bacterium]|nr:phospholipase [Acidobacteriota bacterium]